MLPQICGCDWAASAKLSFFFWDLGGGAVSCPERFGISPSAMFACIGPVPIPKPCLIHLSRKGSFSIAMGQCFGQINGLWIARAYHKSV